MFQGSLCKSISPTASGISPSAPRISDFPFLSTVAKGDPHLCCLRINTTPSKSVVALAATTTFNGVHQASATITFVLHRLVFFHTKIFHNTLQSLNKTFSYTSDIIASFHESPKKFNKRGIISQNYLILYMHWMLTKSFHFLSSI